MHSLEYVRRIRLRPVHRRLRRFYVVHGLGVLLLLATSFFFSPIIHEYGHAATLDLFGCEHNLDLAYGFDKGLEAEIRLFCPLSDAKTIIVLLSGVSATATLGIVFLFFSWRTGLRRDFLLSNFLAYIGFGFMSDIIFYLFLNKGDLIEILTIMGLRGFIIFLPVIGVGLIIINFAFAYRIVVRSIDEYIEIRRKIKKIVSFIEGKDSSTNSRESHIS